MRALREWYIRQPWPVVIGLPIGLFLVGPFALIFGGALGGALIDALVGE